MHRSPVRAFAMAAALVVAIIALSGCTTTPTTTSLSDCGGILSKVLLTDDSATSVAKFDAGGIPKIFNIPSTPAPSCYYVTTVPPTGTVAYTQTTRTLLYIGISKSDAEAIIASLRKTVSEKPWTVRFDYGVTTTTATPTPGATATPAPAKNPSSSARWYYDFAGAATDDKGEMGYYYTAPVSQGTATQAGLGRVVDILRIETELRQVKS